jgi:hypothetical protein
VYVLAGVKLVSLGQLQTTLVKLSILKGAIVVRNKQLDAQERKNVARGSSCEDGVA